MSKKIPLWPSHSALDVINSMNFTLKHEDIECELKSMFRGGVPVLVTSGRSALGIIAQTEGVVRGDAISLFPFAGHCVIDAVGRHGNPVSMAQNANLGIYYHQWGMPQNDIVRLFSKNWNVLVDDCVDSMCKMGSSPFIGDGKYEVWSLAKILGAYSGGVIWCRNEADAQKIKQIRNGRAKYGFQLLMRAIAELSNLGVEFWYGRESLTGPVPIVLLGELMSKLKRWEAVWDIKSINRSKYIKYCDEIFVDKILNSERLPNALPVKPSYKLENLIDDYESPSRILSFINDQDILEHKSYFPIPLHSNHELPIKDLQYK
jgi:putative PLP-dependent aminotransferase (TIGR04422 family)